MTAPTFTPVPTFAIPLASPTLSGCQVGIVGRDAAVTVVGGAPDPVCRSVTQLIYLPAGTQWYALARVSPVLPAAADAACYQEAVVGTLVVTDTGSRTLGASICWQLRITNLNTGTRLPTYGLQVSGHDATIAVFGTTAAASARACSRTSRYRRRGKWVRVGVDLGPFGAITICRSPLASGQVEVWYTGGCDLRKPNLQLASVKAARMVSGSQVTKRERCEPERCRTIVSRVIGRTVGGDAHESS